MKLKHIVFLCAILSITGWGPFSFFSSSTNDETFGSPAWIDKEAEIISSKADNIDSKVLKLGLSAYAKAFQQGLINKDVVTIIDYSKPSSERRMWVFDVKKNKVLFNTWVTHGKNSGNNTATSLSNEPHSLKSSFGVFVTEHSYMGGNGYSLRLIGLERGVNDNAYRRNVVVHGAWYADANIIKTHGQLGRSWGCPAVSDKIARPLIDTIKERTLFFAYYPDRAWLRRSTFLAG